MGEMYLDSVRPARQEAIMGEREWCEIHDFEEKANCSICAKDARVKELEENLRTYKDFSMEKEKECIGHIDEIAKLKLGIKELTDKLCEHVSAKVLRDQISALNQKVELEHENFLSVHRENMKILERNMKLEKELAELKP